MSTGPVIFPPIQDSSRNSLTSFPPPEPEILSLELATQSSKQAAEESSLGNHSLDPQLPPLDLQDIRIDSTAAEDLRSKNIHPIALPVSNRKGYVLNAMLVTALTIATVFTNRAIDNVAIFGTKANSEGYSLLVNYLSANLINHIVKGNIRNVDSQIKQLAALATLVGGTVVLDAIAGAITGTSYISEASAIAIANAAAHLVKLLCYQVVGKKPYLYGRGVEEAPSEASLKTRRLWAYALGGISSFCSAIAGQFVTTGTGLSAISFSVYSQAYRKIGKAVMKVAPTKKERIAAVSIQAGLAVLASVVAGSIFSYRADFTGSSKAQAWTALTHFFGATTAIAGTGYLTDQLIRAHQKVKENKPVDPNLPPAEKKPPSMKKKGLHGAAFLTENALAATMNSLNTAFFDSSNAVSLGSKLWQQGLAFHSLRELLKGTKGWKKAAVLAGAAGTVVAVQQAANGIQTDGTGLTAMSVGLGAVAAFGGKWIRNWLLPKDEAAAHA